MCLLMYLKISVRAEGTVEPAAVHRHKGARGALASQAVIILLLGLRPPLALSKDEGGRHGARQRQINPEQIAGLIYD